MKKTHLFFCIFLFVDVSFGSCFIEEVVDLHDSGFSAAEIHKDCDGIVEESDCTFNKIIRYARRGEQLSTILRSCELKDSPSKNSYGRKQYQSPTSQIAEFCITPYGNCRMLEAIPQGSSCYCRGYTVPIWGIAR